MVNVALVEDDAAYQNLLRDFIMRYESENEVRIKTRTFSEGISLLEGYKSEFDIIFLDIQMPHIDGMELARRVRQLDPSVILVFVTNMGQFALEGYEVNAFDFIVKPVLYATFAQKLARMLRHLSQHPAKSILLHYGGSMLRVLVEDIYYIELNSHRLYYHTAQGVYVLTSGTISSLEEQLTPHHFARCNSGYLVNMNHVETIAKDHIIVAGDKIPISRPRKKEFMKQLTEFVGG